MAANQVQAFDFGLGEQAEMLRNSVRSFAADEIAPRAAEIDREQRVPDGFVAQDGRRSASSASRSRRNTAALRMGYLEHCVAMEEVSRASASVGLSYGAHSNLCVNQIRRNGNAGAEGNTCRS